MLFENVSESGPGTVTGGSAKGGAGVRGGFVGAVTVGPRVEATMTGEGVSLRRWLRVALPSPTGRRGRTQSSEGQSQHSSNISPARVVAQASRSID